MNKGVHKKNEKWIEIKWNTCMGQKAGGWKKQKTRAQGPFLIDQKNKGVTK